MADLYVEAIASAVVRAPVFRTRDEFTGDPMLSDIADALEYLTESRGGSPAHLRFLPDESANDVAALALDRIGTPPGPHPLRVSRSGGEVDPVVAFLPTLLRERDWFTESLVLTHLEDLIGTAVWEFLSWSAGPEGVTVLMVDQPTIAVVDDQPEALTAVALRVATRWGDEGVCVGHRNSPRQGGEPVRGTPWLRFVARVRNGRVSG
ncbi:hypothetical protein ACFWN2_01035 [Lentzea sp. NPDC058436]|uniref:hypothetical protein n=1 Tax=Lentzea sp. NPDC058436 TaxID=3346499 RepID=UPI00365B6B72